MLNTFQFAARGFDRFCVAIDRTVRVVIAILLAGILVLLTAQILLRYFVGIPLFWGLELTGYMFAYVTLMGASSCIRTDEHVRMPLVMEALPEVLRRSLYVGVQGLIIFYAWHLVVHGYRFASLGAGERSPSTYFILFWPRLALVIGGGLIIVQSLSMIVREIAGFNAASGRADPDRGPDAG